MPGLKTALGLGLVLLSSVASAEAPAPTASAVVGVQQNEVKEPAHGKPSETLPRVIKSSPVSLKSGVPVKVRFIPPQHWKINDGAPTWFALFDVSNKAGIQFVHEFTRAEIKTLKIELPKLEGGHSYRAQGTFYICQEKGGSVCLMQSADQKISVSAQGKDKLEISLSQAE